MPAYGWGQSASWSSATSYQDNGSTNSGITCTLTGGSNVSSGPYATNDVRGLLSQVVGVFGTDYTTNSIALANIPNGYYNMAIHGASGGWNDRGATFRVHGMNGDQIAGTTNTPQFALYENYVTTVLFTNVEVTNGILNVDVEPTPIVPSHNPNTEGYYNAVEVQLVSYGRQPPPSAPRRTTGAAQWSWRSPTPHRQRHQLGLELWRWEYGCGCFAATVRTPYSTAGTYTVSQVVAGPVVSAHDQHDLHRGDECGGGRAGGRLQRHADEPRCDAVRWPSRTTSTGSITNWAWNVGDGSSVTDDLQCTRRLTTSERGNLHR